MYLLLAFLLVPVIEIGLFIQVGGAIGLWPTLAIVIITAIAGTWLVRQQGMQAIGALQNSFSRLQDPTRPLADGAMILISGALLLTPGFFTDAVGFALLMPPVRAVVFDFLRRRIKVQRFEMGQQQPHHHRNQHPAETVIDGEFQELNDEDTMDGPDSSRGGSSGWTRH